METVERCPGISPDGWRCGHDAGHPGDHYVVTPSTAQWPRWHVTITLPMPAPGTSPNHRSSWQKKWRVSKKMREDAKASGLQAKGLDRRREFPWSKAQVRVVYYRKDRRGVRDHDNALATLKAAFDGLVDAGLLVDDRGLTFLPVVQEIDKEKPRVEIELHRQV